jgi:Protein of unknown function (DUF2510)
VADLTGWHPDPGGAPGRFRYWDGAQWSAETTDDPGRPAPGSPPPARSRRARGPLVAAVVAGVVVLAVLALVVRNFLVGVWPITIDPAPPPTVIGNDSSPTPTPPSTPSPSPSSPSPFPSPSPRTPSALVPCPLGLPNLRSPHPVDGRVHGGNLSFPAEPSYRAATDERRMTFAYDVIQQQLPVNASPGWIAQLAVGQLRAESGFVFDSQKTAESLLQCLMTGSMYAQHRPAPAVRRSEVTTVSGRQGWLVEADVSVTTPGLPFPGDRVVVVVVPDGTDWGFFFGAAPLGDVGLNQVLDRTVAALQVT